MRNNLLLYSVSQNNRLSKVKNISFTDTGVYIVDDYKNLYLWCGKKASKKKKDFGIKKVNLLNEKRESPANTHVLNQGQEFGAFLAIFDLLKKGLKQNSTVERRPELDLKIEDTLELIEAGIDPDFEGEITIDAHKISQKKKPYEDLCQELAKIQLALIKGEEKLTEGEIKKKYEEIYNSSSTYEEICWLIAELGLLKEKPSFK